MALSLDTRSVLGSSHLGGSSISPSPVTAGQSGRGALASSARIHKHRRRPSNASTGSNSSPAITQFPVFDPTFENVRGAAFYTMTPTDPLPLFKQTRSDSGTGAAFSKKIKPLIRHTGSGKKEKVIDLNLSKAENEERGAYITDSPPATSDSTQPHSHMHSSNGPYGGVRGHSRTLSGASQISSSSAHSGHRIGTTYIHPARQAPHCPTPPVSTSAFVAPGEFRPESSHSNLAGIPSIPSANQYRAGNLANLRSQASTPTNPPTPALIPSAPATARSSIDSAFRDRISFSTVRKSRRPSRTAEQPMDIEEERAEVLKLRREFHERQEKKNEKYRLQEEKRLRDAEQKARRKSEAAESARSKRNQQPSHIRRRGDSSGTVETVRTFDTDVSGGHAGQMPVAKKYSNSSARRGPGASVEQLSAIGYASTTELGRPKMGRRTTTGTGVEDDDEEIQEKIPRRKKTQGAASAGKAARSRWSAFWFGVKTALMKMFKGDSR